MQRPAIQVSSSLTLNNVFMDYLTEKERKSARIMFTTSSLTGHGGHVEGGGGGGGGEGARAPDLCYGLVSR